MSSYETPRRPAWIAGHTVSSVATLAAIEVAYLATRMVHAVMARLFIPGMIGTAFGTVACLAAGYDLVAFKIFFLGAIQIGTLVFSARARVFLGELRMLMRGW